jgi:hypothetical protein
MRSAFLWCSLRRRYLNYCMTNKHYKSKIANIIDVFARHYDSGAELAISGNYIEVLTVLVTASVVGISSDSPGIPALRVGLGPLRPLMWLINTVYRRECRRASGV